MPVNITQDYALLLSLLQQPIAFHRVFVTVTGGVLPALMLSQAVYWHPRGSMDDNWFYKTQAEWERETGMTRWEQETARKKLRTLKSPSNAHVWHELLRGVPAKLHYRVDIAALFECIAQYVVIPHTSLLDDNKQAGGDATNKNVGSPQALYTETTSDNSAKSGKRPPRAHKSERRYSDFTTHPTYIDTDPDNIADTPIK